MTRALSVVALIDSPTPMAWVSVKPFVFGADGDVYMIPETASRGSVLSYRATRFPDRWTLVRELLSDVDRARMAGSVIRHGDCLYRPSQYGAVRYGYGINLHRIDTLNTESYAEVIVGRLLPETGEFWLGCHSITHANGITVLDRASHHLH